MFRTISRVIFTIIGISVRFTETIVHSESYSFAWVRGGNGGKFVDISTRTFVSMDGTLYFAYNIDEDQDRSDTDTIR